MSQPSKNIPFTEIEANAAIQLFNDAVKLRGLEVAENAVVLTKKIQEAFKPVEPNLTVAEK